VTDVAYTTEEISDLSGLTFRQLDYHARIGTFHPRWFGQDGIRRDAGGSGIRRRWAEVDLAAARAVAQMSSSGGDGPRSSALASLAAQACYLWWDRAEWAVIALPNLIEAAFSTAEALAITSDLRLEGVSVSTLVPLAASQTSV
jgi:hypothetical protein